MDEYEFGLIIDASAISIRKWEACGKQPHNARADKQAQLDEVAQLSLEDATKRLQEYR